MHSKSEKTQQPPNQSQPEPTNSHNGNDDTALPAYSEVPAPSSSPAHRAQTSRPQAVAGTPGLPAIDLAQYVIPGASISKDETTVTVSGAPQLCTDENALTDFLKAQAALPPRPQIHITGGHGSYGDRKVDFDIRINLLRYLIPSSSSSSSSSSSPGEAAPLNYVKLIGPDELAFRGEATKGHVPHVNGGLKEWAWRFCRDSSTNKAFVLERVVPNWNTSLLEGRIRNLLASLRYQGRVTVDFPVSYSTVVVTTPQSLLPRLLSFVVGSNRYAVAQAVWPYANIASSSSSSSSPASASASSAPATSTVSQKRGAPRRICAVQSEEEWWGVWGDALGTAIMEKRKGRVTLDDVMDRAMMGHPPVKTGKDWGAIDGRW